MIEFSDAYNVLESCMDIISVTFFTLPPFEYIKTALPSKAESELNTIIPFFETQLGILSQRIVSIHNGFSCFSSLDDWINHPLKSSICSSLFYMVGASKDTSEIDIDGIIVDPTRANSLFLNLVNCSSKFLKKSIDNCIFSFL